MPSSLSRLPGALRPFLRRHLRGPSRASLRSPKLPQSHGGGVLLPLGWRRGCLPDGFLEDLEGQLVRVPWSAWALRHTTMVTRLGGWAKCQ